MARIKLGLPQQIIASFRIPVRITDINYGNHLGNDSLVGIIHEARMQWLQNFGFTEMNVMNSSLIMNELVVTFKNEAFYKEILEVDIFVGEISSVGFELYYSMSVVRQEKSILITLAKTGLVCFNYSEKKVESIPEELKSILLSKK
jgi:acyl-CoA thioesterase FadM